MVERQLPLELVMHPLDEHVGEAQVAQQVGLAGGVAKGVVGPRGARPHAKHVRQPRVALGHLEGRGGGEMGRERETGR